MTYKIETYTYPKDYANELKGVTVPAIYPDKAPGLAIIGMLENKFGRHFPLDQFPVIVHIKTGFLYGPTKGAYKSLAIAIETAQLASAVLDFSKLKTIDEFLNLKSTNPTLLEKLKELRG